MNNMDAIRLEEFRQFRKEIRGSAEYLIVGIDVAKEKHHAFFGTATGKALVRKLVFANNIEGFEGLLEQEEALNVRYGLDKVVYGFEPTGNYHNMGNYRKDCPRQTMRLPEALALVALLAACTPAPGARAPDPGPSPRKGSLTREGRDGFGRKEAADSSQPEETGPVVHRTEK